MGRIASAVVASKEVYEACQQADLVFGMRTEARTSVEAIHHLTKMQHQYHNYTATRSRRLSPPLVDEQSLKILSEHENVRDVFWLGSICSVGLSTQEQKDQDGDDENNSTPSSDLSDQLVATMRSKHGIWLQQQADDVVYLKLSPSKDTNENMIQILSDSIKEL